MSDEAKRIRQIANLYALGIYGAPYKSSTKLAVRAAIGTPKCDHA